MRANLFQRQFLVQVVLASGTSGAGVVVASGNNKLNQKISKTTRRRFAAKVKETCRGASQSYPRELNGASTETTPRFLPTYRGA